MTDHQQKEQIDFAMVLASAVHDMKNSLSMLTTAMNNLESKYPRETEEDCRQLAVLQYESSRVNSSLVQLLGLYKLENQQLPLNINYHYLDDFVPDQVLQYSPLIESKNIALEIDVEDELDGFFDADLISSVMNNILGNTIRYTKDKIAVSAFYDDMLIIEIADNGSGYPEFMVEQQSNFIKSIDHSTGSTGLGLYFAGQIALLHSKEEQRGSIAIFNGGRLGGGVFQLRLP